MEPRFLIAIAIFATACGSGEPPDAAGQDGGSASDATTGAEGGTTNADASPSSPIDYGDSGPVSCAAPISSYCGPGPCPTWASVSTCGSGAGFEFSTAPCGAYDYEYSPNVDTPGGSYALYDVTTGALVAELDSMDPPSCRYGPSSLEIPTECFSGPYVPCIPLPDSGLFGPIECELGLSDYCSMNACPSSWTDVAKCGSSGYSGFTSSSCDGYFVAGVSGAKVEWLFDAVSGAPVAMIDQQADPECVAGASLFEIPVDCLQAALGPCLADPVLLDAGVDGD